jgi:soluble lytic murein transglycosylase-like protein
MADLTLRRRQRLAVDRRSAHVAAAALLAVELLAAAAGALIGFRARPVSAAGVGAVRPEVVRLAAGASEPPTPVRRQVRAFSLPFATFPPFAGPQLSKRRAARADTTVYESLVRDAALLRGLPPQLALAVTRIESDFDPGVISNKGALGLMQVMPATGARFGVPRHELLVPHRNVAAGTSYLAWLRERYRGNLDLTLAAYNAGEGAVDKYGGIPPYPETQEYVRRVRAALRNAR